MKVVLINTSEKTGGAAVAANRLTKALRSNGVEATMLVRDRSTDDPHVVSVEQTSFQRLRNRFRFLWERLIIFINNGFSRERLFQVSIANTGIDISQHPLVKEADVIHLHWINQGFLSLKGIRKLQQMGKPIVWTMHDMWPCTGICHHARECTQYQTVCHSCPRLNLSRKTKDLSTRIFNRKKNYLSSNSITYVPCSQWLSEEVEKSKLTKGKKTTIPNPISTTLFTNKGVDIKKIRARLGLPEDKRLILFGALDPANKRKGIDYLVSAIPLVEADIALAVFGHAKAEIAKNFTVPVYSLGYLSDESLIRDVYAAVDCYATPSLEENLPNMIMESMACGTPCVGFQIGGIPEMIDHKSNGYLAKYKNAEDFARGIDWVLEHNTGGGLAEACIKKVETNYSESVVSSRYVDIYNQLLQK